VLFRSPQNPKTPLINISNEENINRNNFSIEIIRVLVGSLYNLLALIQFNQYNN